MDPFEESFAFVAKTAPELFMRDGVHAHILVVKAERALSSVVCQLDFASADEKMAAYTAVRRDLGQVEWYVLACEAWVLRCKALDDVLGELQASKNPLRQEALIVAGSHRDGRQKQAMWQIKREPLRLEEDKQVASAVSASSGVLDQVLLDREMPGLYVNEAGKYDVR